MKTELLNQPLSQFNSQTSTSIQMHEIIKQDWIWLPISFFPFHPISYFFICGAEYKSTIDISRLCLIAMITMGSPLDGCKFLMIIVFENLRDLQNPLVIICECGWVPLEQETNKKFTISWIVKRMIRCDDIRNLDSYSRGTNVHSLCQLCVKWNLLPNITDGHTHLYSGLRLEWPLRDQPQVAAITDGAYIRQYYCNKVSFGAWSKHIPGYYKRILLYWASIFHAKAKNVSARLIFVFECSNIRFIHRFC